MPRKRYITFTEIERHGGTEGCTHRLYRGDVGRTMPLDRL